MKKILLVLLVACSFSAVVKAESIDCPGNVDSIVEMIKANKSCYDAGEIATQCSFGSSADISIAGAAEGICLKEIGRISASDKKLLDTMKARCDKAYAKKSGTMYLSMNAFCKLEATQFINGILQSK